MVPGVFNDIQHDSDVSYSSLKKNRNKRKHGKRDW